jgi:hypothetical protein
VTGVGPSLVIAFHHCMLYTSDGKATIACIGVDENFLGGNIAINPVDSCYSKGGGVICHCPGQVPYTRCRRHAKCWDTLRAPHSPF